ncbi:hypothetical protein L6164_016955 [Bauhinia variegata]|uniref:Uncharacterized protein n=1 Tax=Bauhinia variegata TaxID=167791 RepID=A0ACB9N7Y2_BAUVA|nr:hypothetical protein L6164_016955 [Bauhinia variegata]
MLIRVLITIININVLFMLLFASFCSCNRLEEAIKDAYAFNVTDYGAAGDGLTDDSQAFLKAWTDVCSANASAATLEVPPGKTFLLKPVRFNGPCSFSSVHFQLKGNIIAPNSTWEDGGEENWISFSDVEGLVIDGGGQINGQGSVWWNACDKKSDNALFIHNCNNLQLTGIHHLNSARNHISISHCDNTNIYNLTITAPQDSPNTDGIDIASSSHINIKHTTISTGDDCIAMNNGTYNVSIVDVTCGPGHGISVGSLGKDESYEIVEDVHVRNCKLVEADNGLRIKTWQGGSGYVRNISFEDITLIDTKNPIIIDQFYEDDEHGKDQISAVKISRVMYRNVTGTSATEEAVSLNCNQVEGCTDIIIDLINITSSIPGSDISASCNNAYGTVTSASPNVSCLLP